MATDIKYERKKRILEIDKLCFSRGEQSILLDISLTIDDLVRPGMTQGQVVALLGPSGIGKTQLFRCIAGLQKPTSGTVRVTEELVPVRAGMVGVVSQNYLLFNHRTVLGNLMIAARQRGVTMQEAKVRSFAMLERYDLADRANFYPLQLSGGQRQRVAIIQQILSSDNFLLMDEPFSGLDPLMKEVACNNILQFSNADELNTVIVITHDVESAVTISDTVWLMGRVCGNKEGTSLGSTIIRQYDLIERGLAWHPEIQKMPLFHEVVSEIKSGFVDCY